MTEAPTSAPAPALPDPGASAAVLIGVSAYQHMSRLPTVANNLTRLREVLTDREIWGLPAERCHVVTDPVSSKALIGPVITAAKQARDLLIVYYAGHGFVDHHGAFHLTVVDSEDGEQHTAVPYDWLRDALLKHDRARRRVIILDCCYSGRALGGMAERVTPLRTAAGVKGSYVLTSAAENVKALAPAKEECTAFSGELVRVLRYGVPAEGGGVPEAYLSLDTIYDEVRNSLQEKGRPTPQQQDRGRIGQFPFVRNTARPAPDPPRRRRRGRVVAVAAGALLATTAATSPIWWPTGGTPSDRCSPRAALLGFSDSLNKTKFRGKKINGLSSLALVPGSSDVLTLADNSPPILYRLALGETGGKPEPEVTAMTELLRADGSRYGKDDFDGEAIALEDGGKTVLVADESRPSIGRYNRATGRLEDELPVPARFSEEGIANAIFESMALTPDGRYLYVGLEDPFRRDGSKQGRNLIRILRYTRGPDGAYAVDRQIAYETGSGMRLAELAAVGDGDRFLALERDYTERQGNTVRVFEVSFANLPDVSGIESLTSAQDTAFVRKTELVDIGACPPSDAPAKQPQTNPLLDNIEGMALGPPLTEGEYQGRRPLYLVTDDNDNAVQITRFYALAVALTPE
ncbi:caspase, EACC1-associated type [Streptomyces sp. UG1]|uniref:caspase, EACC1-associated type n=1 Tax=Streptomyces sp. UG1 TaxID=3417652 RepID=UPI003CF68DEF